MDNHLIRSLLEKIEMWVEFCACKQQRDSDSDIHAAVQFVHVLKSSAQSADMYTVGEK